MLRSLQNCTTLHSHRAAWCRYYCNMDCKTKLKPTRTISKQQTWFKFTLASTNQKQALQRLPNLRRLLREHTFTRELAYEPSNYERAALTFPRVHSITQAVRDSAGIMSRDQKSEPMSSHLSVMQKSPSEAIYDPTTKRNRSHPRESRRLPGVVAFHDLGDLRRQSVDDAHETRDHRVQIAEGRAALDVEAQLLLEVFAEVHLRRKWRLASILGAINSAFPVWVINETWQVKFADLYHKKQVTVRSSSSAVNNFVWEGPVNDVVSH